MFDDNSEYVLLDSVEISDDELELVLGGGDTSNYDTQNNNNKGSYGPPPPPGLDINIKPVNVDVQVEYKEERYVDGTEAETIYAETFRGMAEAVTQGFQNSQFIDQLDQDGARFSGAVTELASSIVELFDAGIDRATEFVKGGDSGK